MMAKERRERSNREERQIAHDRVNRALASASRWLKRRGKARESRATRRAYDEAASVIMNRVRR